MSDLAQISEPKPAIARRLPSPDDCWWRLGPNIRDNRTAKARGVEKAILHIDFHSQGFYLTLKFPGGARCDVWPAEYRLKMTEPIDHGFPHGLPAIDYLEELAAVDLLIDRPPLLPLRMDWQQISRRGDHRHPGNSMNHWRADPWQ